MRNAILTIVVLCCKLISAQTVTVSGYINDAKTGESLISANVYNPQTLLGSTSNLYGFYSLKLPRGKQQIEVSYVGYTPILLTIDTQTDTTININLQPVIEIDEVVVTSNSPIQKVQSTQMSTTTISPKQVNKIPMLLGEPDVIKSFQLKPGVQGGTEGSSGMYVRGGGPDQNLVLLDGVPVYNISHLFGFMSVFNADALKTATLIKGGFPARYGGRLSSVLDIRMKEGNMFETHGEGSIGLISSQLTIEGPIKKGTTSYMVSGRRSYFDLLTYPIQFLANKSFEDEQIYTGYFLQDFNAKVNHHFNDDNRLYLSFYTGKDKFYLNAKSEYENFSEGQQSKYTEKNNLQWGNVTGALRWNHRINNQHFANLTASVSNYRFGFLIDSDAEAYTYDTLNYKYKYYSEYFSQIRDYAVKLEFDYYPAQRHYIRYGLSNTVHLFSPGVTIEQSQTEYANSDVDTSFGNVNIPANEFYAYIEDDYSISQKIKINAGFHYSIYRVKSKTYQSFEPRLSSRVLLTPSLSFKLSYARMQQYLHLLSNTSLGLPTDLWVPATDRVKPQTATQYAAGIDYSYQNKLYFSIEGYYKKMHNLIEYAEGASFFELTAGDWQDLVTSGKGESYGFEFLAERNIGKTTGWIGYTLSWSNRTFPEISFGKTFPYSYDSRNDISIVLNHKFSDKFDMGLTWVYRTGNPFTLEDQKLLSVNDGFNFHPAFQSPEFINEPQTITDFEHRNNYRKPDYHRLDVGFNFHKQKKRHERTWSLGVYNAYGRLNPFAIIPNEEYNFETGATKTSLEQVSIFSFIPYFRYTFKF